ncbi:MAG: glycosyl hydrolase [Acidobacteria bacterium]|nr:MAG: glycosyl hydrolase [Acidobacteriota bacterium]REK10596.1 MAG: glycosyl hydrolase [Acidobacteriota bacterium]
MSGRIADIALHPDDPSTWYVAVGSGGVWKTTNAGTTIEPIFEGQGSYSIGCVTVDPNQPEVIWVGTGENVSGRHVAFGDGVYRSLDGGATWRNMGLRSSEHISRILVDPRDSDVVLVASEGPLWSSGGERGVFRSLDRGESWEPVLEISPDTGVASLVRDPSDPDVLLAATYQRRRTVWSLLAGGPESGIWKSTDGGDSWREVTVGLPQGDMGKIGLAIAPQDPRVAYATIEAAPEEAGFYRSLDGGETWERRNGYHSGGTGPHYYQEIFASPHRLGRVYQMDVFIHVTEDGGATFRRVDGGQDKHSDNHALAFSPHDPDYLLAGTDAGLYESFDLGRTWKFVTNLPVTQIYKAAVDDDFPTYHMLGGTQDNGTIYGPARSFNQHGVRDQDWSVPYGADGYDAAIEPGNPDVLYVSWQQGHPLRFDRRTGELVDIQPQPAPGDPPERFNWDAPIRISPHAPQRLYYGSQRLWRSDDRGDSWQALSGDLTRGDLRYELPVDGRRRSIDALWGNTAMSVYATLTSIDESPLVEGLLYVGSDDGLIQVSEDGGATWRRAGLGPAVPERAFVNQVRASLHDPDTVFAALDNHKEGDYRPYLLRSTDRGRTWTSLSADLGERDLVWALEQDHVDPELLFLGAEFGLYFSLDGGGHWQRVAGSPHLAFRDLEIQRRENDLVAASFGRGFYVLDDYTPLRAIDQAALDAPATLFPVRDTLWFVPELELQNRDEGSKGSDYWSAENPPYGALLTYHLSSPPRGASAQRREREQALDPQADVPLPDLETLRAERSEPAVRHLITVRDDSGEVVRRLEVPGEAGFHRVAWDLRLPDYEPVRLETPGDLPPWYSPPVGPLVPPGRYTARLSRVSRGQEVALGEERSFELKPIFEPAVEPADPSEILTFQRRTGALYQKASGAALELARAGERLDHLEAAIVQGPGVALELLESVHSLHAAVARLEIDLVGDDLLRSLQEPSRPSILGRLGTVIGGHWSSRQGPTRTHRESFAVAEAAYAAIEPTIRSLLEDELPELERAAAEQGARWTPGRRLDGR